MPAERSVVTVHQSRAASFDDDLMMIFRLRRSRGLLAALNLPLAAIQACLLAAVALPHPPGESVRSSFVSDADSHPHDFRLTTPGSARAEESGPCPGCLLTRDGSTMSGSGTGALSVDLWLATLPLPANQPAPERISPSTPPRAPPLV